MSGRVVLDMADRRPVWAMPDWVPGEIREALPPDWTLVVVDELTDGSGDGATRVSPAVLEAVRDAEVYLGYGIPVELLRGGPSLRWVHSGAAGVGSSLHDTMKASDVIFTNSAGIHASPMAETVLGMLLFFARGIDFAVANQHLGRWSTDPFYEGSAPPVELAGSVVGIVGYGGIGREVARRVTALGAHVVAVKRTAPSSEDARLTPVGGGVLDGRPRIVHGPGALDEVLERADFLVVTAPDTPETRGMIGSDQIARLRPGAVLVNVARGRLVDEGALLEALRSGRLRGAGLDVFAKEPLAEGHPLWRMEHVLVTPHVSAVSRGYWRRETDLIVRNLRRYLAGTPVPEWENVVDKAAGY
jgi:phosphoglycerate dehydrogenase-like enzyme